MQALPECHSLWRRVVSKDASGQRPVRSVRKWEAAGGGQGGLACRKPALLNLAPALRLVCMSLH